MRPTSRSLACSSPTRPCRPPGPRSSRPRGQSRLPSTRKRTASARCSKRRTRRRPRQKGSKMKTATVTKRRPRLVTDHETVQATFDFWMPLVGAVGAWGHLDDQGDRVRLRLGWGPHQALSVDVYTAGFIAVVCKAFVSGAWCALEA